MADRWEQAAQRYNSTAAAPPPALDGQTESGGDRWQQAAKRYAASNTAVPGASATAAKAPSALRRFATAATEDLGKMFQPDPRGVEGAPQAFKEIVGGMFAPGAMHPDPYGPDHPILNAVHSIPLLGPTAAQIGNDVSQGKFAEAAGHATVPALMSMSGGGPEEAPIHAEIRSPVTIGKPALPYMGHSPLALKARVASMFDVQSPLNVREVPPSTDPGAMSPPFRYGSTPRPAPPWQDLPEPMRDLPGDVNPIRPEPPVGNPAGAAPSRNPVWRGTPAAQPQAKAPVNPVAPAPRQTAPAPARVARWEGKVSEPQPKTTPPVEPIKADVSLTGREPGGPQNATGNVRASQVKPFESEEVPAETNTVTSPETAPETPVSGRGSEFHVANQAKLAGDVDAWLKNNGVSTSEAAKHTDAQWAKVQRDIRPNAKKPMDKETIGLALERAAAREARFGAPKKPAAKHKVWTKEANGGVVKMARGGVVGAPADDDIAQLLRDRGGIHEVEATDEHKGLGESIIKASGKAGPTAPKLNVVKDPTEHVKEEQAFLRHPNLVKLKIMGAGHPILKKLGIHITPGAIVRHAPHKNGKWKTTPVDLSSGKLKPGIFIHVPKPPKTPSEDAPEPMRALPGEES